MNDSDTGRRLYCRTTLRKEEERAHRIGREGTHKAPGIIGGKRDTQHLGGGEREKFSIKHLCLEKIEEKSDK